MRHPVIGTERAENRMDDWDQKVMAVQSSDLVRNLMDFIPDPALILDDRLKILAVNTAFLGMSGIVSAGEILGNRPGNILGCAHAALTDSAGESPSVPEFSGCGDGLGCPFCGICGTVRQAFETQTRQTGEARMAFRSDRLPAAGEWKVQAVPFDHRPYRFVFVALKDLSAEKRRKVLERLFFHDIMNSAWGIHELSGLLPCDPDGDRLPTLIHDAAAQMVESIRGQRLLLAAEDSTLSLNLEPVEPQAVLNQLVDLYQRTSLGRWAQVLIERSDSFQTMTDSAILYRVFENMLKNALEACSRGEVVTIRLEKTAQGGLFQVHNSKVMDPVVQAQLFQRSFTTKDQAGRGLGTYSMKLFGERYLKGQVGFESREGRGTTFHFRFPSLT